MSLYSRRVLLRWFMFRKMYMKSPKGYGAQKLNMDHWESWVKILIFPKSLFNKAQLCLYWARKLSRTKYSVLKFVQKRHGKKLQSGHWKGHEISLKRNTTSPGVRASSPLRGGGVVDSKWDICMTTSFDYKYQNPLGFAYLMLIRSIVIYFSPAGNTKFK